ncbi:MAG: glycogen synthase [Desulfuromonadaceae bacterium]|nr:glycogen synthase [Desulfuromonadaceae bacterium]
MKVTLLTKEYPPHIYGGAGVHVKNLAAQLAALMEVEVRCIGEQESRRHHLSVKGYQPWERVWEEKFTSVLGTFSANLAMVGKRVDADVIHAHTWYASLAGFMAKMLYNVPFVATVHSIEPLRPWKEEQLGRSYHLTNWAEKIALENADRIIAVSHNSRAEILQHFDVQPERIAVIHNGIDISTWKPSAARATRRKWAIPRDYILFVGRTSRQKGMKHLIQAMERIDPGVTLVCCTSAPDTPEVEQEIAALVARQPRVLWINELLREEQYVEIYSHAQLFVCPSIYEPFGITNLEAMACEKPVVASAVGGIPEVVVPGETGYLVPPADPRALAEAINTVLRDRRKAKQMGRAGRKRVEERFTWQAIAWKTMDLYRSLLPGTRAAEPLFFPHRGESPLASRGYANPPLSEP